MGRQLTKHFHSREFDCRDGTPVPEKYYGALEKLCRKYLEPMRKEFGPCTVVSGFRTKKHNAKVGGASRSFHRYKLRLPKYGVAADVRFKNGSVMDWLKLAQELRTNRRNGKGGLGFYPQGFFIHIDTRDYPANWNGS